MLPNRPAGKDKVHHFRQTLGRIGGSSFHSMLAPMFLYIVTPTFHNRRFDLTISMLCSHWNHLLSVYHSIVLRSRRIQKHLTLEAPQSSNHRRLGIPKTLASSHCIAHSVVLCSKVEPECYCLCTHHDLVLTWRNKITSHAREKTQEF